MASWVGVRPCISDITSTFNHNTFLFLSLIFFPLWLAIGHHTDITTLNKSSWFFVFSVAATQPTPILPTAFILRWPKMVATFLYKNYQKWQKSVNYL